MTRTITTKKYEVKEIGTALANLKPHEKHQLKAHALSQTNLGDFSLRGVDVAILTPPIVNESLLTVSVKARKNNQPLIVDNPLIFHNPPIMVHDGTYHEQFLPEFNTTVQKQNYVEDPLKAFQEIIVQAIELQNK